MDSPPSSPLLGDAGGGDDEVTGESGEGVTGARNVVVCDSGEDGASDVKSKPSRKVAFSTTTTDPSSTGDGGILYCTVYCSVSLVPRLSPPCAREILRVMTFELCARENDLSKVITRNNSHAQRGEPGDEATVLSVEYR